MPSRHEPRSGGGRGTRGASLACWMLLNVTAATGCVANQDVKTASTEVSKTLVTMRGAEQEFAEALLAEVKETKRQVARAVVASIVYAEIRRLADELETKGDLITLSQKISDAEARADAFMQKLEAATPPANPDTENIGRWVATLLSTPDLPAPPDALARIGATEEQVRAYLRLTQLQNKTQQGLLVELDQHLNAIATVHAQVDRWIQTDITVDGDKMAQELATVAEQFPQAGVKP